MAADSKDTAVTDENTETAVETAPEAPAAKPSCTCQKAEP